MLVPAAIDIAGPVYRRVPRQVLWHRPGVQPNLRSSRIEYVVTLHSKLSFSFNLLRDDNLSNVTEVRSIYTSRKTVRSIVRETFVMRQQIPHAYFIRQTPRFCAVLGSIF